MHVRIPEARACSIALGVGGRQPRLARQPGRGRDEGEAQHAQGGVGGCQVECRHPRLRVEKVQRPGRQGVPGRPGQDAVPGLELAGAGARS